MKQSQLLTYTTMAFLVTLYVLGCSNPEKKNYGGTKAPLSSEIISDSLFLATSGSLAMNNPDQFNWEVFARVCRPATFQAPVPGTNASTNNAIWETWADDSLTFPDTPHLKSPPQFPTDQQPKTKRLVPSTQQSLRHSMLQPNKLFVSLGGQEEVRRNKESFDFIIQNDLWYKEGLVKNFAKRAPLPPAVGTYIPIAFTPGAIEVKAMWKEITESDKPNYHWNYDANGKLYGMTAFHIMTKALPNWTWATWEWVGNPGRCADMGCHDAFGVTPADIDPHKGATGMHSPSSTDTPYPGGELTPELLQLFKKFGLGDEWKNYRLKGSQIDWIDATGRPTFVGNSITEDGFVNTSSCITCHSNASFDKNGDPNPSLGFDNNFQDSQYGSVDPRIFWSNGAPILLQTDFVWGIRKAKPSKK